MILINILHASSCVGKSTYMMKAHKGFYKIEMDDTQFWTREEKEWPSICFEFLVKHINNNKKRRSITGVYRNMLVTCGGLPTPEHPGYKEIEAKHNVIFRHTLILTKDSNQYFRQIKKRKRGDIVNQLMEHYKWRESTKNMYDEIIINKGK